MIPARVRAAGEDIVAPLPSELQGRAGLGVGGGFRACGVSAESGHVFYLLKKKNAFREFEKLLIAALRVDVRFIAGVRPRR